MAVVSSVNSTTFFIPLLFVPFKRIIALQLYGELWSYSGIRVHMPVQVQKLKAILNFPRVKSVHNVGPLNSYALK